MIRALALVALALLAGCGSDPPPEGVRVSDLTIDSEAVGDRMPVKVVAPEGDGRPLLVFLHGRGHDEGTYVHDPLLTALDGLGARAPVVAFPYGGEHSYWHDRADGDWGRYVTGEVIPQVLRAP